ncbi:hypothetical protein [Nitrosospira lacus]|uniref:hypothetical protein n=1 Tax=Nitrosospira lacus TaxID=1288494 RepID=UPI00125EE668|nr:hypothetical protein [Nitrosospira lacus]
MQNDLARPNAPLDGKETAQQTFAHYGHLDDEDLKTEITVEGNLDSGGAGRSVTLSPVSPLVCCAASYQAALVFSGITIAPRWAAAGCAPTIGTV